MANKMKKEKKATKVEHIIAVRKNEEGNLSEFKTNSGKVFDYEMALEAIEQGKIDNAQLFTGRDGKQHIRSKNDGETSTQFSKMKNF